MEQMDERYSLLLFICSAAFQVELLNEVSEILLACPDVKCSAFNVDLKMLFFIVIAYVGVCLLHIFKAYSVQFHAHLHSTCKTTTTVFIWYTAGASSRNQENTQRWQCYLLFIQ